MQISKDDEEKTGTGGQGDPTQRRVLPLLPLRDVIVFPYMVVPLYVGREKSIAAIDEAMAKDKEIFLAAQKRPRTTDPVAEDIYEVGTIGTIHRFHRLPDGTVKVLVEGQKRARIRRFEVLDSRFAVEVEPLSEPAVVSVEVEAL